MGGGWECGELLPLPRAWGTVAGPGPVTNAGPFRVQGRHRPTDEHDHDGEHGYEGTLFFGRLNIVGAVRPS